MVLILWGLVVIALAGLGWGGQVVTWLSPAWAVRYGICEAEDDVEPAFWADIRGEAQWDAVSLWTMVVAGALMVFDHRWWPLFGLVGGGMYLYFAGRGILTRLNLRRRGLRIGSAASVRVGLIFLMLWGAMALVTIGLAVAEVDV
ncbi:MAG: hypothetical protein ACR2QE_14840 [Acidimicrobiales bacterium]